MDEFVQPAPECLCRLATFALPPHASLPGQLRSRVCTIHPSFRAPLADGRRGRHLLDTECLQAKLEAEMYPIHSNQHVFLFPL